MPDRFDRFTERARRVLMYAQEEALRFNHNYIGTEHLLLGLIREGDGVAARALADLDVEVTKIRSDTESVIGRGDRAVFGEIGLTPRAKKVIELAVDEARRLGHHYIGTEHLLLGLVREGESTAAGVLESLGVSLDKARDAVLRLLSQTHPPRPVFAPPPSPENMETELWVASEERSTPNRGEPPDADVGSAKFTLRARQVMALAQEEALRFNHNYIGTEHLLLGLTRTDTPNLATLALARLGVSITKVRSAVEFIIGRGDRAAMGEIALTPRAKKVIELTVEEARISKSMTVGPEHLLRGLVREGEGIAAGVLESLGVSLDRVRSEVIGLVKQYGSDPSTNVIASAITEAEGQSSPDLGDTVHLYMRRSGAGIPRAEPAQIIDGKAIAEEVRAEVKQRADRLHERGITPGLALILVGDNPSSLSYVRSKGDSAEQAGIYSDMFHLPETTDEDTLISRILEINRDDRFHAVLVQLPLPKQLREDRVVSAIDPAKDADGQTAQSAGRLLRGEPTCWPATPAGIVETLHRSGHPPAGKHVVVCGRSNIVGKPIAAILMQKSDRANATLTLCHTATPDVAHHTRQADILIAAMGVPAAITADMVKPGAVVIDVGNNWVEDATRKSGRRLVGDVDYEAVREVAGAITPVPGGVGPMTIAMLLSNTVWLAEQQAGRG